MVAGLAPVLALALLVSACASPSVAPPTAVPVPPTGSAPPAASWEAQWNALLAAARQEGTVAVLGPPTPELRRRLPEAFQQRFGIAVEYTGQPSGDFAARLASERSAGVYSADVVISGSNSMYEVLADRGRIDHGVMGMLAPLRPALLLPEILDPIKYRAGQLPFVDPAEQYVYRMNSTVNRIIAVNTDQVRPNDLQSWYDLLKPEYRGGSRPTIRWSRAPRSNHATALYLKLGPEFVRRLYVDQQPFVTRDHRQMADLLARGSQPIALSLQQQEVGA